MHRIAASFTMALIANCLWLVPGCLAENIHVLSPSHGEGASERAPFQSSLARPLRGMRSAAIQVTVDSILQFVAQVAEAEKKSKVIDPTGFGVDKALTAQTKDMIHKALSNVGIVVSDRTTEAPFAQPVFKVFASYGAGPGMGRHSTPDSDPEHRLEYKINIELWQVFKLQRDESQSFAVLTWKVDKTGLCQYPVQVKEAVATEINLFIADWLSVNPRPKNEK